MGPGWGNRGSPRNLRSRAFALPVCEETTGVPAPSSTTRVYPVTIILLWAHSPPPLQQETTCFIRVRTGRVVILLTRRRLRSHCSVAPTRSLGPLTRARRPPHRGCTESTQVHGPPRTHPGRPSGHAVGCSFFSCVRGIILCCNKDVTKIISEAPSFALLSFLVGQPLLMRKAQGVCNHGTKSWAPVPEQ